MTLQTRIQSWISVGLLASAVTLAFAPVASADSGWRRYKGNGPSRSQQWPAQHRSYIHESGGGAGPVLAGLIGGFILGAAVSHPTHVIVRDRGYSRPEPQYRYYDPSDDEYYDSIDECGGSYGRRPQVIRVIEVSSGNCVRTMHWQNGGWCDDNGNRGGYRNDNRRDYRGDNRYDDRYDNRDRNRDDNGDWDN